MPTTRLRFGAFMTKKRHSGFGQQRAANTLIALGQLHLGLNPSAEKSPNPIGQFAPHSLSSHPL
jgi:hypothetical protein